MGTGSSDTYVNETDSANCESLANENDIWTSDYELTATATEIPAANKFKAYNTPCSYWGTFSPKSSFTFKNIGTFFSETCTDDTYKSRTYGTDVVSLDNITLNNFTFGVTNHTIGNSGILGISLPLRE